MSLAAQCAVEGCQSLSHARGWCQRHYFRWRRHGDPEALHPGAHRIASTGYRRLRGDRADYEHRAVLLEKLGPGTHPCHWCAKPITWGIDLGTDHLDNDKLNNDPENLVPSCQPCNVGKANARRYGNEWSRKVPA